MTDPHMVMDLRDRRRVFIVGDIHGEFEMLKEELEKVSFIPSMDALVSVGDLTDRGPDSLAALEWIKQPWFHRVLGNHCTLPRMVFNGELTRYDAEDWGGQWFSKMTSDEIKEIALQLEEAPVAMTVLTPGGLKMGVVHADCASDWNRQIKIITSESSKVWATDMSLYSRETIKRSIQAQEEKRPFDVESVRVANIDFVFHGHSVLAEPFTIANRSFIDTGACYGGTLSVIDVDSWVSRHTR